MKPKVMMIGGNLRANGISAFVMMMIRNLHDEFDFIVINTAPGESHYRDEALSLGCRIYDVIVNSSGPVRSYIQAKEIRKICSPK